MFLDAIDAARLPPEVQAGKALRASAARRARVARRRRSRRRTRTLVVIAACGLIAVPTATDGLLPSVTTAQQVDRCALPVKLRDYFVAAARVTSLPIGLLAGVARVESRFVPDAESKAGAIGVMQLMPSTADSLHLDALEPSSNVLGGAVYLRQLLARYGGNVDLALAAYNAGPTAVDDAGGAPSDETRAYVGNVERTWRGYGACT